MSFFLSSGAGGLKRFPCFKYYNVMKQKSRFTLELNVAKINDYIKKHVCLPKEWSYGAPNMALFQILFCTKNVKVDSLLGSMPPFLILNIFKFSLKFLVCPNSLKNCL